MENQTRQEIPVLAVNELQNLGWAIAQLVGSYCVAWRGNDELTLKWSDNAWKIVSIRTRRLVA